MCDDVVNMIPYLGPDITKTPTVFLNLRSWWCQHVVTKWAAVGVRYDLIYYTVWQLCYPALFDNHLCREISLSQSCQPAVFIQSHQQDVIGILVTKVVYKHWLDVIRKNDVLIGIITMFHPIIQREDPISLYVATWHIQSYLNLFDVKGTYRKTSSISRTLVGNKIVENSDVVGASPVGAAPTTSSFST